MVRVGVHALSGGELRETLFQARDATAEVRVVCLRRKSMNIERARCL